MKLENKKESNVVIFNQTVLQKLKAIEQLLTAHQDDGTPVSNNLITREELCKRLGVTAPTIIKWERKKKIHCIRIGRNVRYHWDEVLAHLKNSA